MLLMYFTLIWSFSSNYLFLLWQYWVFPHRCQSELMELMGKHHLHLLVLLSNWSFTGQLATWTSNHWAPSMWRWVWSLSHVIIGWVWSLECEYVLLCYQFFNNLKGIVHKKCELLVKGYPNRGMYGEFLCFIKLWASHIIAQITKWFPAILGYMINTRTQHDCPPLWGMWGEYPYP